MRTSKDFLQEECASLAKVLEETLRFKYGLEGSKEFFEECQARLAHLSSELSATLATDLDGLAENSRLLGELSALISRIERSYIEEYSWPFVEELKGIAIVLCTEPTAHGGPNTPPQVHVVSEGGLSVYAIYTEQSRPTSARKRIHVIRFPRTLKHFVLLHAILGHEVGHAMWRCSQHQAALNNLFLADLFNAGPFLNPAATAAWLYSPTAPPRIQDCLRDLATKGINAGNFFGTVAIWAAWAEEVICDFIGLLTFGPSFVAAASNLLYALDPAGTTLGPSHPPVGCRVNYLLRAAQLLALDTVAGADPALQSTVNDLWANLQAKRQTDPWFDVFTDAQLRALLRSLSALLTGLPPSMYVAPAAGELTALLAQLGDAVPPVGFRVAAERTLHWLSVDFRHVLYAGWLRTVVPNTGITFEQLNRLCEHGIMQQRAIKITGKAV